MKYCIKFLIFFTLLGKIEADQDLALFVYKFFSQHEQAHLLIQLYRDASHKWVKKYVARNNIDNNELNKWENSDDTDGDYIPDEWEQANEALGFDYKNRYSFPNFPISEGDDEEVYAEIQAVNKKGDASQDWSYQGKQWIIQTH
jgi:hypothetical protein